MTTLRLALSMLLDNKPQSERQGVGPSNPHNAQAERPGVEPFHPLTLLLGASPNVDGERSTVEHFQGWS